MVVMKFGGSSLSSGEKVAEVVNAVLKLQPSVVVLSAPSGEKKVTDMLIECYRDWLMTGKFDLSLVEAKFREIAGYFGVDFERELRHLYDEIASGNSYDYVVSRGEWLMAKLFSQISGYNFVDAAEIIKFDLKGKFDLVSTKAHIINLVDNAVVPGFYGKMPNGEMKLFPRGGSDVTGSALAFALNAKYCKFTDVEGVHYSPILEDSKPLKRLSYEQAKLLCFFGAKVFHYDGIDMLRRLGLELEVGMPFLQGSCIGACPTNAPAFTGRKGFIFMQTYKKFGQGTEIAERAGLRKVFTHTLLDNTIDVFDMGDFSVRATDRVIACVGEVRCLRIAVFVVLNADCGIKGIINVKKDWYEIIVVREEDFEQTKISLHNCIKRLYSEEEN